MWSSFQLLLVLFSFWICLKLYYFDSFSSFKFFSVLFSSSFSFQKWQFWYLACRLFPVSIQGGLRIMKGNAKKCFPVIQPLFCIFEWRRKNTCNGPGIEKTGKLPDCTYAKRKLLLGREMWFLTIMSLTENYLLAHNFFNEKEQWLNYKISTLENM